MLRDHRSEPGLVQVPGRHPSFANLVPDSVDIAPTLADCRPNVAETGPCPVKSAVGFVEAEPKLAGFGTIPDFSQCWAMLARLGPSSAKICPDLAKLGPVSTEFQTRLEFDRVGVDFAPISAT